MVAARSRFEIQYADLFAQLEPARRSSVATAIDDIRTVTRGLVSLPGGPSRPRRRATPRWPSSG